MGSSGLVIDPIWSLSPATPLDPKANAKQAYHSSNGVAQPAEPRRRAWCLELDPCSPNFIRWTQKPVEPDTHLAKL
ncbi:hypothetical protein V6N13_109838 [Hibiscus sabdariffa]